MTDPDPLLREFAELAAATGQVAAPPALAQALVSLTALARTFFGAAACSVAVLDEDEDGDHAELVYTAATGEGRRDPGVRLPIDRGIAGWVAQSGQPIAVSDLSRDVRFARDVAESTSYVPRRSWWSPLNPVTACSGCSACSTATIPGPSSADSSPSESPGPTTASTNSSPRGEATTTRSRPVRTRNR